MITRVAIIFLCSLICSGLSIAQVIDRKDFHQDPRGPQGEEIYEKNIDISNNISYMARVEVTAKGNGVLTIANLSLHIFDYHDNGSFYVGGLLHVEFTDISGDGFKDLVITGTVADTGEKETDPVSYCTVTSIYIFQPREKQFHLAFHVGPELD